MSKKDGKKDELYQLWIQHVDLAWTTATYLGPAEDKGKVNVKLNMNGTVLSIPGPLHPPRIWGIYEKVSNEELQAKCDNLVDLETINEGIILHHVKTRFQGRKIYTLVGTILIAVNPYQSFPDLYKEDVMEKVRKRVAQGSTPTPHVFTIAANALSEMIMQVRDQSVLISGESGSGKTETTKKLLQFLSNAGSKKNDIASAILDSNPILESFGNAKTLRNNNSSRFGKYMEVNYKKGERRGEIIGCKCISYLLEKSRVVRQTLGERNYHIFYMLLAGAESAMIDEYKLKKPSAFNYLNQSDCMDIDGRKDKEEFELLLESFKHVGFADNHRRQILQCLAGILHLGNVQFIDEPQTEEIENPITGLMETKMKEDESIRGAVIKSTQKDLQLATRMLEMVDRTGKPSENGTMQLEHALCYVMVKGAANTASGVSEVIQMPLSALQSANNRDALAKACYDKLFDKIVAQVNRSLFKGRDEGWNIGVLDIFGFEVFETNSFEQLCINYCNEKLQTFFNEIIFDVERNYYTSEGIDVEGITYKDNKGCVNLIDLKAGGIFTQVAEIAVKRSATDDDLCKQLVETFAEKSATKSEYFARPKPNRRGAFIIRHFAGDVTYSTDGFIEKNKDKLQDALVRCMEQSTLSVFNEDSFAWDAWAPGLSQSTISNSAPRKDFKSRETTSRLPLASKFKIDLDSLVVELSKTSPQFVRCVKPNDRQQPNLLDPCLTLSQLKYSGLFEAIRIRKSGYPLRLNHEQFLSRYKHCIITVLDKTSSQSYAKALMNILADKIGFTNRDGQRPNYAIGHSKVFIRREEMGHALDDYRESNSMHMATPIQKIIRGWLERRRFFKLVGVQKMREIAERKAEESERSLMHKEHESSIELRKAWMRDEARKLKAKVEKEHQLQMKKKALLEELTKAALVLQRNVRARRDRIIGQRILCERTLEVALTFDTKGCADCRQQRTCIRHHTRECNMLIMRQWLRDAVESKITQKIQEALQKADDSRISPKTRCICLHIQEDKAYRVAREALIEHQCRSSTGGGSLRVLQVSQRIHTCDCHLVLLKRAIARPVCGICTRYAGKSAVRYHRCIKNRNISSLQASAKKVILETLEESYIRQQLRDAVDSGSTTLLQAALEKADSSRMTSVDTIAPIYNEARAALADQSHLHETITKLQQDLARSISVPKLLSNVDIILKHVKEARAMGLGGEPPVLEALTRVSKIKSLVAVRDRLRLAIEICSPSLIECAMAERDKLIPVFGPDLLENEARGAHGMRRMLGYLIQVKDTSDDDASLSLPGPALYWTENDPAVGIRDVMLPPYVCKELCAIRNASPKNPQEMEQAMSKFVTLVPHASTRARLVRIFKWVTSFAPWRFQPKNSVDIV